MKKSLRALFSYEVPMKKKDFPDWLVVLVVIVAIFLIDCMFTVRK